MIEQTLILVVTSVEGWRAFVKRFAGIDKQSLGGSEIRIGSTWFKAVYDEEHVKGYLPDACLREGAYDPELARVYERAKERVLLTKGRKR